jgi:hypothetical protein
MEETVKLHAAERERRKTKCQEKPTLRCTLGEEEPELVLDGAMIIA